jgi:hypothetical protein
MIEDRLGPFHHKTFAASNPSFGLEVTNKIIIGVKLMV